MSEEKEEMGGYFYVQTSYGNFFSGRPPLPCKFGPYLVLAFCVCERTKQLMKNVFITDFLAYGVPESECDAKVLEVLREHDVEFKKLIEAEIKKENEARLAQMIRTPITQHELAEVRAARLASKGGNGSKIIT